MTGPKIALVGEAYGENEERLNQPFVGASGMQLISLLTDSGLLALTDYDRSCIRSYWTAEPHDSNYLALLWSAHLEFHRTNVFMFRPKGNDLSTLCASKKEAAPGLPALKPAKYLQAEYMGQIDRLRSELRQLAPDLIIAFGNTASWALLGTTSISKIRGVAVDSKLAPGIKVLPTYHPAAILRQWDLRATTVMDLQKAKREAEFKEIRRPERVVYIEPTIADLHWFYEEHIQSAKRIAIDIETSGDQISCIGFATSIKTALTLPFIDQRNGGNYWPDITSEKAAWAWVRLVCASHVPKVFQNGLFDIHRLWRGYGLRINNAEDDTMLLSHSLQPEALKGLAYLGSIFTDEASWKLEVRHSKTIKKEA